jgi:hypothetical protein
MKPLIVIFLLVFSFYGGCKSPKTTQKEGEQPSVQKDALQDTTERQMMMKPAMPTTIKQNITIVGGVVESVVILDSINYQISFLVNTALPEGGLESIAEIGQKITAVSSYVVSEGGSVDIGNERNQQIFRLRSAVAKDVFIGKISLTDKQGWVIVDVESFK